MAKQFSTARDTGAAVLRSLVKSQPVDAAQ